MPSSRRREPASPRRPRAAADPPRRAGSSTPSPTTWAPTSSSRRAAVKILRRTLRWRRDWPGFSAGSDGDLPEELVGACNLDGADCEGHPVCYKTLGVFADDAVYKKALGTAEGKARFLRWRVRAMERHVGELDLRPGGAVSLLHVTVLRPQELANLGQEGPPSRSGPEFACQRCALRPLLAAGPPARLVSPETRPAGPLPSKSAARTADVVNGARTPGRQGPGRADGPPPAHVVVPRGHNGGVPFLAAAWINFLTSSGTHAYSSVMVPLLR